MITNYQINQPFTSDLSVEEGEKIPVALEIMGPAELSTMLKPFFTLKPEKSVEGKPYSRNNVKANSFRAGQILFWFPSKKAIFHYSGGISTQAGKRSSRSITER